MVKKAIAYTYNIYIRRDGRKYKSKANGSRKEEIAKSISKKSEVLPRLKI